MNLDLAMEVLPYFRISEKRALEIISSIKSQVSKWNIVATKMGISRLEQERMKNAFLL
jgi:serine/threonine-protein kinase HipA